MGWSLKDKVIIKLNINKIKYYYYLGLLRIIISLNEIKFIRKIGKSILHYENNELTLYTTIKKSRPIVPKFHIKVKPSTSNL